MFDVLAENYNKTMRTNKQHLLLINHLKHVCDGLEYSSVLDVGIGTGKSVTGYLNDKLKVIYGVDPSVSMLKILKENKPDKRIKIINKNIEDLNLNKHHFDLAVFAFSLSWLKEPINTLKKICKRKPTYIIISEQVFEKGEAVNIGKGHPQKELITKSYNPTPSTEVDSVMKKQGYFPLIVLKDDMQDTENNPSGKLMTILYTKTEPDNTVYEKTKLIVQINLICNKNCPACYRQKGEETLSLKRFNEEISKLSTGDMISIRGGEPTLYKKWLEDYIEPSLRKGLKIAIDTNGQFIDRQNYKEVLEKLMRGKITVRISFDEIHLEGLNSKERAKEFEKMAMFAKDAEKRGISFGFYALGMDKQKINKFIEGTPLQEFNKMFHSLTLYEDISDIKIKGKYLKVNGEIEKNIS